MSSATIAAIESANAMLAGTSVAPITIPRPKAETRRTLSGSAMPIGSGTITDGQIRRLQGVGVPLTNGVRTMSMADASDLYFALRKS